MLSNSQKLERLFDLYETKMYKMAFYILKDKGQAEDAVQDAFIKVMSHLHRIREPETIEIKYFMMRLIRTAAIDIYRKNKKDRENLLWDLEDAFKNQISYEDIGIVNSENRELIKQILADLQPQYREILELKYYFGMSHQECASYLNVSVDAIAKRFERAKKAALKMMEGSLYE